jgi:hypothetical protein
LRQNLGRHPDVFTVPRELKYFNHPKRVDLLGAEWYRAQFEGWAGEPITGEATPGYMMFGHRPPEVAARIKSTVPDVRLIALLRDPVDRAYSAFVHHQREDRIHPRARLVDAVRQCKPEDDWMGIVTGGWYAASLEPFVDLFGDQLLVLLYDDITANPEQVYAQAVRHVGAPPGFVPAKLANVVFSNPGGGQGSARLSAAERQELFDKYFCDEVGRLERMLGRDLSMWRTPDPSG